MDLALSDEQRLLADSAQALLAACSTPAAVRAAMDTADGLDTALWRQLGEQGWCSLFVPEAEGGQGLGLGEGVLLMEALGAHLACVPFFDSVVLAGTALQASGARPEVLKALGSGVLTGALSLDGVAVTAAAGGWQVHGDWPAVGSAHLADGWLLPVRAEGELALLWVPRGADGFSVVPRAGVDATRRCADVRAEFAFVPADRCVARAARAEHALQRARLHGAVALAAEQVGVAARCLEMTCAYVQQREQFGRAIATFQAVKHRCAQMLVATESARSAVYGAACVFDALPFDASPGLPELQFAAAQALCAAHEAAAFATQEALQLHGGMGYTWECDAHLYLRRAQASRQRLGPPSQWLEAVAADLLDGAEATA